MKTDRVVLITGAAGGIGSVLVDRFLADGDRVVATDTRQDDLDRWRGAWPAEARLSTAAADITSERDLATLADAIQDQAGRVDVLVHAAGFFPMVPFTEMTTEQWRQVIDVNLTGAFPAHPGCAAADDRSRMGEDHQLRIRLGLRRHAQPDALRRREGRRRRVLPLARP